MASGRFVPAKSQTATPSRRFVPSKAVATSGGRFVPAAGAKKKGGGQNPVLGLVENFAGDVKDAVTGLPRGLVETAQHPIRVAEKTVEAYRDLYGPISDVSAIDLLLDKNHARAKYAKFGHKVYENPLGPVLDVATVFTAGAGAAARGTSVLSKGALAAEQSRLASITLRSPRALAAEGKITKELADLIDQGGAPTVQGRTLSRNPVIRARQQAVDRAMKRLPPTTWKLGENARYGRELDRGARRKAFALQNEVHRYNKALDKLNADERVAIDLIARGLTPDEWKGVLERSAEAANEKLQAKTLAVLSRPKVAELVNKPSKNLLIYHEESRRLSEGLRDLLIERKLLTPEAAQERLFLHKRIASGARLVEKAPDQVPGQLGLDVERLSFDPEAPPVETLDVGWQGGKTPDEIQAELEAAQHPGLVYLPDRMVRDYVANPSLGRAGGGLSGDQQKIVHQSKGVLFQTARLALGQDTLGPAYLRAVKYALFDDIHTMLEQGAVRVPINEGRPEGLVWLRRKVIGPKGSIRGEKIPYTAQHHGDLERQLEELIPDPGKEGTAQLSVDDLTTTRADDAITADGYRLAIPEALARQVAGEFTRSGKALRMFVEKPTQVWRSIVLGYRPGFLVNNVVGNHLLLAIHFLGPAGIAAYIEMLRTSGKHATAEKLLRSGVRSGAIDKAFISKWFPEFAGAATYGRTQTPRYGPRGEAAARKLKAGILPATQAASETALRRVAVSAAIRHNPDVKRIRRAMPKEARSWRAAADKAFEQDPRLIREVTDQVNASLGDYLSLSAAERSYVRAAIPFWAWYRAILTIAVKLPLDHPGRALLLTRIGQVGAELQPDDVPTYLQGALPVGPGVANLLLGKGEPGTKAVLSTTGLNPFGTIVELGIAARQLGAGDPGSAASTFGGNLNPFLQASIEQLTGRTLFSGGQVGGGGPNPIQNWIDTHVPGVARVPASVFGELPPVQFFTGPSKLYPARDPRAQFWQFGGAPVKRYDPQVARQRLIDELKGRRG